MGSEKRMDPGEAKVAVVIPAYDVAERLGAVIRGLPDFVRHVVVVDDGSRDDTAATVEELRSDRVRIVRHAENRGVGAAVLSGYAAALELGAEVVVKVDGDGQMDPAQLARLVEPILAGEADYAKGNRFLHAYALPRMPWVRRVGNFGLTFMAKAASGYWRLFDPTNGYTAIHARILRLLDTDGVARRSFFETSMLLELRRLGAVVVDVPMPARYGDERSTLSPARALGGFPPRLVGGLLRRLGRQYFLHDFNAVSVLLILGLPLLLFGVIFGAIHWYLSISTGQLATTGTVLLAVLPIILGVQFLVQGLVLDIGSAPTRPKWPQVEDPASLVTHRSSLERYLERSTASAQPAETRRQVPD